MPSGFEKLVPNLREKEREVLHYGNLQLYLSLGMRLKKIHRALCFKQSPWMEPYIRMDIKLRKKTSSDFEKDLYKLMNNSVFGKTIENLRKCVHVKLVRASEENKLRRLIANQAFARANIFDDDLAAIQMHKRHMLLNRPVYTGLCVFDLSKHLMYDFYYKQIKTQYGERCQLLYTDTDSLLLEIKTDDVYQDMAKHAGLYDMSDYPPEHPLHSVENKKVLGKNEGRVCWAPNRRICRPAPEDVLHPRGLRQEHQEGQGRQKDHREEAHQAWAVDRGPLWKADLSPWHWYPAVRAPPHLWTAPEQGITLTLWLQALDRRIWGGHTSLWAQRCNPCRLSSSTIRPRQDPIRRQLCVRGYHQKFLADESPVRPILQVVQHRIARSFLSVAWLTGVQLLVFFCSSAPVVLFDTPGISRYLSQHVPVESSSLLHHSI